MDNTDNNAFEGVEKKLELHFSASPKVSQGLRILTRDTWDVILEEAKCKTLTGPPDDNALSAFVLSESSLFVYSDRIILKTCGTTKPLSTVSILVEKAADLGQQLERCVYSRRNFLFPQWQPSPHKSFDEETEWLNNQFSGTHYTLGHREEDMSFVYIDEYAAPSPDEAPVLEVAMHNIDAAVAKMFERGANFVSANHTTEVSGIGALCEGMTIDAYSFDPVGYSMNAVRDGTYVTIHVTPEDRCSYVSFETNERHENYTDLVSRVVGLFKPQRFTASIAALRESCNVAKLLNYCVDGFDTVHRTSVDTAGCHTFSVSSFVVATTEGKRQPARHTSLRRHLALARVLPRDTTPEFDVAEFMRRQIRDHHMEDAFYVCDLGVVRKRITEWRHLMPRVEPFFAIKCNPDKKILPLLAHAGLGFDCASGSEIERVLKLDGVTADRVIFANPCKLTSHIRMAKKTGVSLIVFDNAEELVKIAHTFPEARLVLRILTDDSMSLCKFGTKYGALASDVPCLLAKARDLHLNVIGLSFHVGSGCMDVALFEKAIRLARDCFDVAEKCGVSMELLDIGGGFPGGDEPGISFSDVAKVVTPLLDDLFPEHIRIIAEPGRFFAAASHTLCTIVHTRRVVPPGEESGLKELTFRYYLDDGVYGSFNNIVFDHATVTPTLLNPPPADHATYLCSIFGPTCDSFDCIGSAFRLPELQVGDWIYWRNMGAYTRAAASNFNGFNASKGRVIYVDGGVVES